jgi:hypothetical protein
LKTFFCPLHLSWVASLRDSHLLAMNRFEFMDIVKIRNTCICEQIFMNREVWHTSWEVPPSGPSNRFGLAMAGVKQEFCAGDIIPFVLFNAHLFLVNPVNGSVWIRNCYFSIMFSLNSKDQRRLQDHFKISI